MPDLNLSTVQATPLPPAVTRPAGSRWSWAFLIDVAVFLFVCAAIFGVYAIGRSWLGPVHPHAEISQNPRVLPLYALYSLVRISVAYVWSVVFALAYGYIAASSRRAEIIMVPLLDILQSIPVLSFLPGVMLAMVAIFPHSQLGVELGSILLIFTGQVWNIAFSFYSSLKTIPRELNEVAILYRFSRWQRFAELDLPFSTIGLVWNSMMSVAGGWFFLMACEMFVLGKRDFRLPGLGSFLQTAASHGNTRAILWGLAAMIAVIVLLDQLVWRPIIVWADKFKFEQVESSGAAQSTLLNLIGRASIVLRLYRLILQPVFHWLTLTFTLGARRAAETFSTPKQNLLRRWSGYLLAAGVLVGLGFALFHAARELSGLHRQDYDELLESAALTFLRVNSALILGALWTVPVGVAIGANPRLARIAQPLVQMAASIPATALFPIILLFLLRLRGGLEMAAMLLMLLGTQWYILFNVIAGAMAIPTDLQEAAQIYRFRSWDRWRHLILPGIFPYLVTGMVTASGGAWNASIVAEYFHFQGRIVSTAGLGSTISSASDSGRFDVLLASTLIMATVVVLINRLLWRRLYRLASSRFKLET
ncbi:MAG: binding-protein-dependent transport system inner rane component [Candidatus Acidoferrum typicum]|nr:binding-protein-dependent transport system inner rane component [Candidatus Acidoferrum typicum]